MAVVMLPKTRGDYYFVIDHGWQNKLSKEAIDITKDVIVKDNNIPN